METLIIPNTITKTYVTYILHKLNDELYHIGVSQLANVISTPDARRIKSFEKDMQYRLEIVGRFNNRGEALQLQSKLRINMLPKMPTLTIEKARGDSTVILCSQSGRIWHSISALCKDRGCYQSTISNHLNGRSGFKSVAGYNYKRIPCNQGIILARLRNGETLYYSDIIIAQPIIAPVTNAPHSHHIPPMPPLQPLNKAQ